MDSKSIDRETLVKTITIGVSRVVSTIKSSLTGPASSFEHTVTAPSGKCLNQTFKRLNAGDVDGEDTFENIECVSVVRNEHEHQQENGGPNDRTATNSNLQTGPSRSKNQSGLEASSRCTELSNSISNVANNANSGTAMASGNIKLKLRPNIVMHDNRKFGITGMFGRLKDTLVNLDQHSKCDKPPKLSLGINSAIHDQVLDTDPREQSISINNNCSLQHSESLCDSETSTHIASYDAMSFSTSSSRAQCSLSSLEKSGGSLLKSPSLTDLSILTKSFTGSGSLSSVLRNSLTSDNSSYFDKKRNELSKSSVIYNSNREFEEDLKFLSGCGDKTSTPDRPMFEGRPKAVHNTDQFQRPMLSVPRSLPPSLTKMRSFGLGLSPLTNFSLAGSDISSNRTNHARRSLKFDEETAVHEHRTSIFQDHRRSFSDFFVPKLSGQHSSAHITSIPNTYPVIDGIEGEHSLNKLQHSDAYRKEPYPNCTLSGYPYSSNSLGSIAACFTRIPNALIKPIFLKEERMENPNRVETSSQREAIVSRRGTNPILGTRQMRPFFILSPSISKIQT